MPCQGGGVQKYRYYFAVVIIFYRYSKQATISPQVTKFKTFIKFMTANERSNTSHAPRKERNMCHFQLSAEPDFSEYILYMLSHTFTLCSNTEMFDNIIIELQIRTLTKIIATALLFVGPRVSMAFACIIPSAIFCQSVSVLRNLLQKMNQCKFDLETSNGVGTTIDFGCFYSPRPSSLRH